MDFVMLYCANPTIHENTSKNYVDEYVTIIDDVVH